MDLTDDYFAYGADLDPAWLRARAGEPQVVSSARLVGYRVAFFGHDPVWDSGMGTLVADEQAETWGMLYRLRPLEWERLDVCMGANVDGGGATFHYPVEVTTPAGESRLVRTYRKATRGEPCPPSREFIAHLVALARSCGLPQSYLAALGALPSIPARYPVPKQDPAQHRHLHVL